MHYCVFNLPFCAFNLPLCKYCTCTLLLYHIPDELHKSETGPCRDLNALSYLIYNRHGFCISFELFKNCSKTVEKHIGYPSSENVLLGYLTIKAIEISSSKEL